VGLNLKAHDAILVAAEAGFEGVDLLVRDIVDSGGDVGELRRRMDDLGLRGGAWPLPVNWRGDAARFRHDLERLHVDADAARRLDLLRTGTWVLPESLPPTSGEVDDIRRTTAFHLERLGQIAYVLANHEISLGLEIMGSATARTGTRTAYVQRYVDLPGRLGQLRREHPNVGVLIDTFHLFASGESPEAVSVWSVDSIVWVHVADSAQPDPTTVSDHERALPGETGLGDTRALLELLARRGYEGPVSAEPLGVCASLVGLEPLAAARRTRAAMKWVWPGANAGANRDPLQADRLAPDR
jgi:sugar phosphate isomerase/epimerase